VRTEDDLRAALTSLERHTPAAERVLPGTASPERQRRAGRGLRSPKATGWASGIATAAALAGVGLALTLPGTPKPAIPNGPEASPGHAAAPATLKAKLLAAFSAASREIVYERSTFQGGTTQTQENWYYPWQASAGQQVRSRQLILTADGTPQADVEDIYTMPASGTIPPGLPPATVEKLKTHLLVGVVAAIGEIIDVEYGNRTWSDQKDHLLLDSDPASPKIVLYDINHENWTVVGHTELDGHDAIKLSWTDAGSASYLWVDASTYLPLREVVSLPVGGPGKMISTTDETDYELLPATPANLALLTTPVPAGFTQTATQVLPESGPGLG
jgi:hypothetical protein